MNDKNERPETRADIVREMRARFAPYAKSNSNDARYVAYLGYKEFADRIEAVAERERREYEKLHDCYWAKDAIQSIVRQMLGARDDLRRVDPREADDLDYYAHELMKAARSAPGNAAAMREALQQALYFLRHHHMGAVYAPDGETLIYCEDVAKVVDAALSAPARNCDRFATAAEAIDAYQDSTGDRLATDSGMKEWVEFCVWLFATAEGGAE